MSARISLWLMIVASARLAGAEPSFEPGHEVDGAVAAGAARITEATTLAKDPARTQEALAAFQSIAAQWPASLHDCYLALAYLRVGDVTAARLAWDVSASRGGARPKWCTGDLARQLATAMRDCVEVELAVTPEAAVVELDRRITVKQLRSVWWPASAAHVGIDVRADGFVAVHREVTLVAPRTQVEVVLQPVPAPEPPPTPVPPSPSPSPSPISSTSTSTSSEEVPPPPIDEPHRRTVAGKYVAIGGVALGVVALGGGLYFLHHYRDQANGLYTSDPAYDDARTGYDASRWVTLGGAALTAASGAYLVYTMIAKDPLPRLQVAATPHGAMLVYGVTR